MWKKILIVLLLLILSALVWIFGPPLGFTSALARGIVIGLIWLPVLVIFIWRRVRAIQGARSIEKALEQQAADHARNVAPDRRDEIEALTQEIGKALRALKTSRLGRGRRGQTALYALPWYMIVGPPAAGKSTALLASGLQFPYTPASGKGIRGVGGTRNCDWWFTHDAILLDTAGRYMTEEEDRDEWMAFLALLKKNRPKKPLNGVLVAVAITDLLDADPDQLDEIAAKLRGRIDEVMQKLELVVPAYVLFTKCDLLPGFVEFFGDLRKQERGQLWGATLPLDEGRQPEDAFLEEFDLLGQALAQRGVSRLGEEQKLENRELIYQFPMQFRAAREPLAHFIGQLFQHNPYQESPIFRGLYFTSGTQEGRPIDRVMGEMARAFGMRERAADAIAERRSERKSYFLRDLFTQVIFPDQNVAGRSHADIAKRKRAQTIIAGATGGVGALMLLSGLTVGHNNSALVDETTQMAEQSAKVPWEERDRSPEDFDKLERLRARLVELEGWTEKGPPLSYGLGMFVGSDLAPGVRSLYHAELDKIMISPVWRELGSRVAAIRYLPDRSADARADDFGTLKTYLMMTDPKHVERGFLSRQLLPIWKEYLRRQRSLPSDVALTPHLATFSDELATRGFAALPRQDSLVEQARSVLRRTPEGDSQLASIIGEAKKRLQPVELRDALEGQVTPALLGDYKVPGCYTRTGWEQYVRHEIEQINSRVSKETWVLTDQASSDGGDAERAALRARYFQEYASEWKKFLRGVKLRAPADPRQTLSDIDSLTAENPPYQRMLRFVIDQVSVKIEGPAKEEPGIAERIRSRVTGSGDKTPGPEAPKFMPPLDIEFGKLRSFVGEPAAKDAPLTQYLTALGKVRDAMRAAVEEGGDAAAVNNEIRTAKELTSRLMLETLDTQTASIIRSLFEQPLMFAAGGAGQSLASGLSDAWKGDVIAFYQKSIHGKYPFARSSSEATLADVTEFFKEGGKFWSFYEQKLSKLVARTGDNKFHPQKPFEHLFSGAFLHCLETAAAWSSALFPPGAQALQVDFEVRPQPVGSGVGEVDIEIEGQKRSYRNTPEERWTFKWPGEKTHNVVLGLKGQSGPIPGIEGKGEWALFHFMDIGKLKPGSSTYEWTLKDIKVPLVIRPMRSQNPLTARPGPLNCPDRVH
ncbi:MAG TPA: type VI secretion system membrane subunit TssM [Polyangia bacterium]|nr:type VI secretion system membrane subunit TssM [Polyangia bacterium]